MPYVALRVQGPSTLRWRSMVNTSLFNNERAVELKNGGFDFPAGDQ